jgi:hypothetical protein
MKYQKLYESKNYYTAVSLAEIMKDMPANTRLEDIKVMPTYTVQSYGGTEMVGFKFVIYKPEVSEF